MKKHKPTKQELQEGFHTNLSFEEALRQIANTPKEDVENHIQANDEDEPSEIEPNDEQSMQ